MVKMKMIKTALLATDDEIAKQIEEAAYYTWLNRGRYGQTGNDLNDWMEAEKELRDRLKVTQSAPYPVSSPVSKC